MQIMIDIPKEEYERLAYIDILKLRTYIENGTPLPKHGRLVDADAVIDNGINKGFCDWYDEIKMADTIIEADRSDEE